MTVIKSLLDYLASCLTYTKATASEKRNLILWQLEQYNPQISFQVMWMPQIIHVEYPTVYTVYPEPVNFIKEQVLIQVSSYS